MWCIYKEAYNSNFLSIEAVLLIFAAKMSLVSLPFLNRFHLYLGVRDMLALSVSIYQSIWCYRKNVVESRTLSNALISKYSRTCSSPCNHSHKQPAQVTTTIVKTGLNCYLNFVMSTPVSNCDHFWNYPTGLFLCF